jgi:hypothetical protein
MSDDDVRVFRYVPLARIPEYLALGWTLDPAPLHPPHGFYRGLMEWRGDGEPIEPREDQTPPSVAGVLDAGGEIVAAGA